MAGLLTLAVKKMSIAPPIAARLAPLQRVMLGDSLNEPSAGHHVEQVEIVFSPGAWRGRVAAAWLETVARTEVLQIAFGIVSGEAAGIERVVAELPLTQAGPLPGSLRAWLAADRRRPLCVPRQVPWRAVYWPHDGRFVWTFHHALLDGRSIATVLRAFLSRLARGEAADLALAEWHPPTAAAVALADEIFRRDSPPAAACDFDDRDEGKALRCLGADLGELLELKAADLGVSSATVLIWAWGQALAEAAGTDSVTVEQVRAGAPQPGTAGFTMLTLPLSIPRSGAGDAAAALRELRARMLALRAIEGISPADLPAGVFPDLDRPGSSVVMVERGTLRHLIGADERVESLVLHEAECESLVATAHLLPDLRLQVEGPSRRDFLQRWVRALERVLFPPPEEP